MGKRKAKASKKKNATAKKAKDELMLSAPANDNDVRKIIKQVAAGKLSSKAAGKLCGFSKGYFSKLLSDYRSNPRDFVYCSKKGRCADMGSDGAARMLHSVVNGQRNRNCETVKSYEKRYLKETNIYRKSQGKKPKTAVSMSQLAKSKQKLGVKNNKHQNQNVNRKNAIDSTLNYCSSVSSKRVATRRRKIGGRGYFIIHPMARANTDAVTVISGTESKGVQATYQTYKTELFKHKHSEEKSDYDFLPDKLPPLTLTKTNATLPQAIKYVFTTTKHEVGPVLAIIADPDKDEKEMTVLDLPGCHPDTKSDIHVVACKTRAGNAKLWKYYFDLVESWLEEIMVKGDRLNLFKSTNKNENQYERGAVLSMDGELQQLAEILGEERCAQLLAKNIVILKHPSNCSLVCQANDLGTMHKDMKLAAKKQSPEGIFTHVQHYLLNGGGFDKLFTTNYSTKKKRLFAETLVVIAYISHATWSPSRLEIAHRKAGWADDEIDMDQVNTYYIYIYMYIYIIIIDVHVHL